jgi:hypothetical protein
MFVKYRTMKAIQIVIIALAVIRVSALLCKRNLMPIETRGNKKTIYVPIEEVEYVEETWDDGEVSWDLEPYYTLKNISQIVSVTTYEPKIISNREKLWGLVEELRMQGAISGFLNVAYYNTAVSDNIVNDIQNYHVKTNMNLENIIIYNFNNEIDIILTLLTIYGYRKYKESRIVEFIHYWEEKYKNNYYLEEYRDIRKISGSFALMILIIFCKSVKSAS